MYASIPSKSAYRSSFQPSDEDRSNYISVSRIGINFENTEGSGICILGIFIQFHD